MPTRQLARRQRPAAGVLGPVGELGVALSPALEPAGQVGLRLLQVAPVVDPEQLLQAGVVGLARQVVQRATQEVHAAARRQAGWVKSVETARLIPSCLSLTTNPTPLGHRPLSRARRSFQLVALSRLVSSTAHTSRRPSQLSPKAINTACERITPAMRTI
jgi:hypothetical protein